jgi:hypothetical protein
MPSVGGIGVTGGVEVTGLPDRDAIGVIGGWGMTGDLTKVVLG